MLKYHGFLEHLYIDELAKLFFIHGRLAASKPFTIVSKFHLLLLTHTFVQTIRSPMLFVCLINFWLMLEV